MNDSISSTGTPDDPLQQVARNNPVRTVERDGVEYTLLGTAHVSRASAEAVAALLDSGHFDTVALELCPGRYQAMLNPDAWKRMDLFQILRSGKAGLVAANLALSAYQRRIAEQFGIEPGAEMKTGIEKAQQHNLRLLCIDRDVGLTLRRVRHRLSFWEKANLLTGMMASLLSRERIDEDEIEQLKQGDLLESTFAEFADRSRHLYESLIDERDRYMAAKLLLAADKPTARPRRVLAVVGAGHLEGLARYLSELDRPAEEQQRLEESPPPARWSRWLPWIITAVVLAGFAIGFSRSPELGWNLVKTWVLVNGSLSAVGALLAGGHPLTILSAFLAAPLTSLNPAVGAGMVTALVETTLRKPTVEDFDRLRDDVTRLKGWWTNRVSRVFLVFFLSNLGSAAGTWVAGFSIAHQLA